MPMEELSKILHFVQTCVQLKHRAVPQIWHAVINNATIYHHSKGQQTKTNKMCFSLYIDEIEHSQFSYSRDGHVPLPETF